MENQIEMIQAYELGRVVCNIAIAREAGMFIDPRPAGVLTKELYNLRLETLELLANEVQERGERFCQEWNQRSWPRYTDSPTLVTGWCCGDACVGWKDEDGHFYGLLR